MRAYLEGLAMAKYLSVVQDGSQVTIVNTSNTCVEVQIWERDERDPPEGHYGASEWQEVVLPPLRHGQNSSIPAVGSSRAAERLRGRKRNVSSRHCRRRMPIFSSRNCSVGTLTCASGWKRVNGTVKPFWKRKSPSGDFSTMPVKKQVEPYCFLLKTEGKQYGFSIRTLLAWLPRKHPSTLFLNLCTATPRLYCFGSAK